MSINELSDLPAGLLSIVPDEETAELGAGTTNGKFESELASLDLDAAFQPHLIVDPLMAAACHSGLWLAHNFLDESHTLSQSIDTPTGSFWHGIMHRREGDFSNAKYWFRRTGYHPAFESLATAACVLAKELGTTPQSEFLKTQAEWDPMAFVDLCENAVRGRDNSAELCARIARKEWELLMAFCFRQAIGQDS